MFIYCGATAAVLLLVLGQVSRQPRCCVYDLAFSAINAVNANVLRLAALGWGVLCFVGEICFLRIGIISTADGLFCLFFCAKFWV